MSLTRFTEISSLTVSRTELQQRSFSSASKMHFGGFLCAKTHPTAFKIFKFSEGYITLDDPSRTYHLPGLWSCTAPALCSFVRALAFSLVLFYEMTTAQWYTHLRTQGLWEGAQRWFKGAGMATPLMRIMAPFWPQ